MIALINTMLFVTAFLGLVWGLTKRKRRLVRIYQLPFLMSLLVLLYIIPGFIGAKNQGLPEDAIVKTVLMTIFCVFSSWSGYYYGIRVLPTKRIRIGNTNRMLFAGFVLTILSGWAYGQLGQMTEGTVTGFFTSEGAYSQLMEGPLVVYKALSNFGQAGLMFCLIAALRKPTFLSIAAVAFSLIIPLAVTLLLGRRFETFSLAMTVALSLFFEKKLIVPRWTVLAAIPLALTLVIVAPEYRKHSQIGGDYSEIYKINTLELVADYFIEGAVEIRNGIYIIGARDQVMRFQWGGAYYNGVIRNFVPKFLVGQEFKEKLMIDASSSSESSLKVYNWERAFYSFPYGPAVAFEQFWYFGCIVFFGIFAVMGRLWKWALLGSIWSQAMYVALLPKALIIFLTEQTDFIVGFLYSLLMLGPLLVWVTGVKNLNTRGRLIHKLRPKENT
jgi:hypothetical protein